MGQNTDQMQHNQKTIGELNGILEQNHHAYAVYRQAARTAEDSKLQEFLNEHALSRARFGLQIATEIQQLGGTEQFEMGANTWWKSLCQKLNRMKEAEILSACMEGERAEADKYNEVLEANALPGNIRKLIIRQRDAVEHTLDEVQALKLITETQPDLTNRKTIET